MGKEEEVKLKKKKEKRKFEIRLHAKSCQSYEENPGVLGLSALTRFAPLDLICISSKRHTITAQSSGKV